MLTIVLSVRHPVGPRGLRTATRIQGIEFPASSRTDASLAKPHGLCRAQSDTLTGEPNNEWNMGSPIDMKHTADSMTSLSFVSRPRKYSTAFFTSGTANMTWPPAGYSPSRATSAQQSMISQCPPSTGLPPEVPVASRVGSGECYSRSFLTVFSLGVAVDHLAAGRYVYLRATTDDFRPYQPRRQ